LWCVQAAAGGGEPSDAIRAVNALLTQLDQLRRFPNVMVLTTSNITEAIDVAFVDRADIKVRAGGRGARRHSVLARKRTSAQPHHIRAGRNHHWSLLPQLCD
jgi:SpoVK/Ycf46/Vps4 family AAA+-type ATPase